MTEQEINALTQLLQRLPMTLAEAMWVNALLERLRLELARRRDAKEGEQ